MYSRLAIELKRKLTSDEWNLVSYYILKADECGDDSTGDTVARRALEDAISVALSKGEASAARKIQEYLKFY